MAWAYVAAAAVLAAVVAAWLRRQRFRRDEDVVYRTWTPWWIPLAAVGAAILAGPVFAPRPSTVVVTYLLALVWGLALTHIDVALRHLPDALVLPAYPVTAVLLGLCSAQTDDWSSLLVAAASAGAAVAVFFLLAVFSPGAEGLGLGDVKLAGVLGALLGWLDWSTALFGLLTGFVIGGLVALVLLITRKAGRSSDMAFGPAMMLGAYAWCLLPPPA